MSEIVNKSSPTDDNKTNENVEIANEKNNKRRNLQVPDEYKQTFKNIAELERNGFKIFKDKYLKKDGWFWSCMKSPQVFVVFIAFLLSYIRLGGVNYIKTELKKQIQLIVKEEVKQ